VLAASAGLTCAPSDSADLDGGLIGASAERPAGRHYGKKVAPENSHTAIELVTAVTVKKGMKFIQGQQGRLKVTISVADPGVALVAIGVAEKLISRLRLMSPPAGTAAGNATPMQVQTKGRIMLNDCPPLITIGRPMT
jgi:hypothetical protein